MSDDWRQEVLDAIDRGAIKKADTLEELAEKVGLDPDRFVAAVKRWNEVCETGRIPTLPFLTIPSGLFL